MKLNLLQSHNKFERVVGGDSLVHNKFERIVGGGPPIVDINNEEKQNMMDIDLDGSMTWISSDDDSEEGELFDFDDDMNMSDNECDIEFDSEQQISNFIWFHPDWFLYSAALLNKLFTTFNLNASILPTLEKPSSNRIVIFSQMESQEQQFEYFFKPYI
eukprot:37133_1